MTFMTKHIFENDSDDEESDGGSSYHDDGEKSVSSSDTDSSSDEEEKVGGELDLEEGEDDHDLEGGEEDLDQDLEGGEDQDLEGGEDQDLEGGDEDLDQENQEGGADLEDLEEEDLEEEDEGYLQKFNQDLNKNYIMDFHPETVIHNEEEVAAMCQVVRDAKNNIIDDLHKTLPYLTKYEKARILGQRAKQINAGAKVFVQVPEKVIDGYIIAEMELKEKRIPFIIRRPMPNGGCEYWHLRDLEMIDF
jgi:DNA-directed RNA polymerase I, II, and III subunit RPABC2